MTPKPFFSRITHLIGRKYEGYSQVTRVGAGSLHVQHDES